MRTFALIAVMSIAFQFGYAQKPADVLRAKAEQGDPAAQTQLGELLFKSATADPASAISWWIKAAQKNYVPAMVALGRAYYNGKTIGEGVDADLKQAWKWFQLAAHAGDAESAEDAKRTEGELSSLVLNHIRIQLADALISGDGVSKEPGFAVQLYSVAAQNGSPEAQSRLVFLYFSGEIIPRDLDSAQTICKALEKQAGRLSSDGTLHYCYAQLERASANPDWKKVVSYYKRAFEAPTVRPYLELADLYAEGTHVKADPVRAMVLYAMAFNVLNAGRFGSDPGEAERLKPAVTQKMDAFAAKITPEQKADALRTLHNRELLSKLLKP